MAAKRSGKGGGRAPAARSNRKTTRKGQTSDPLFGIELRPDQQREIFALLLITIALGTLIFFATGIAGGIGQYYMIGVQQAFGAGALIVPVALGLLGGAILIQERFSDTKLSGTNVLGTALILAALLALLEFRVGPRPSGGDPVGVGGGLVGWAMINLLAAAIGRPVTFLLVCVAGLAGVLLTFNVTLRDLTLGTARAVAQLWAVAWGGPRRAAALPRMAPQPLAAGPEPVPFADPDNEFIATPIAERQTRASLFRRPEDAQPPAPSILSKPAKAAPAQPSSKAAPVPHTPPTPAAPAAPTETVQEALDGIGVPAVHRAWPLPPLDLLDIHTPGSITDDEKRSKARLIEATLANFKVEAQVVGVNTGPAITQFELQPAVGVKISKITSLERDLALALAAPSIRIEAPIPGKAVVGIEIPNSAISIVGMREVVDSEEFETNKGRLKLPLGKDVSGLPVIADMARMPHLLMAGSTGSGKSAAINSYLCGLLLKHTPDDLKLIMVDPKMVELIVYNNIPHLLSPVVTELERVVPTLKWATREMERRYKVFAKHGCRNLDTYRQMARRRADLEPMPYIVVVIDELADLMMMAPDEIETQICRLAQMARATGIHLIVATQRPSVDVITGLIKANFPSRIAFAVTSQIDSRVILDTPGADQLLGRGDMLYMAADAAKLVRIQGTWVSDNEVERIVNFWRTAQPPAAQAAQPPDAQGSTADEQAATPTSKGQLPAPKAQLPAPKAQLPSPAKAAPDALSSLAPPAEFLSTDEQDALLPQAVALVKQHQRASASLLQRRLRIGYSKAAQLIDLLEQGGYVGPAEGGRSREVLRHNEEA